MSTYDDQVETIASAIFNYAHNRADVPSRMVTKAIFGVPMISWEEAKRRVTDGSLIDSCLSMSRDHAKAVLQGLSDAGYHIS